MISAGYNTLVLKWLERILIERFSEELRLLPSVDGDVFLVMMGSQSKITIDCRSDIFLVQNSNDLPCAWWDLDHQKWSLLGRDNLPAPGYDVLPQPLIEEDGFGFRVHFDILGLIYWMLNRIEEVGSEKLDEHQRFSSLSSHAYRNNYLDRPIVDEWLEVLGQVIRRTWPSIEIKRHNFSIMVSHDVDVPSCYAFVNSFKRIIWHMGGDLFRRHNPLSAFFGPWIYIRSKKKLHPWDSMNTFNWIMEQSEAHSLRSAFYFICGRTNKSYDADYEIGAPAMRQLLCEINSRGHEIGLHPSYETFRDSEALVSEAQYLRQICSEEGIDQDILGGRMHVLRWAHPMTLYGLERAGLTYDSTLSYADHAGFRCGTCHQYQAFDPV